MARSTGDGLVVARTPFFAGTRMVGIGEVWAVDDPIVRNYPKAFKPIEVKSSAPAPAVTRRPVRKTTTRTTRKKAASKK